ncbi:defensin beta 132 [Homo sapiens]|uniref:Beta-defensin 132 n=1 Tax=Homo sapiens TaxID=9606 RepID=DB132_HUMAN|nr:beta-defensin 132 precursor [Homo sapiens]Q7Z7B7.1 RecName: Full=Beta-defensin 132; AltName: Full=Beta-defensin 32; Short=BD-32; Short=DEFB-32; AltName: Full=Defensin HEL-75; AltName: Full=Defensin, beta 132; Flags: Precursor [Homo sapiens]AAI37293.1 Defensin, beta 132 [Homo sapiens]AAI37294.1 Defensin, beta 132 [Homo sapiens]AAP47225.1 beta-defensin 32 precursor [Homo sapiens]AAQ89071.1 KFLL827 [Homo sapiens]AAT51868.1 beta-defensin 133 [Homo sapiens]|eukprot:NP_997352.1 beta-defensin 132 precursor [Homo sapiens]
MKFLLLVLAALGFLTQVIPASAGGSKCVSNTPGYCRTCCHWGETALFMCNASRKCCISYSFLPKPDLPQLIGNHWQSRRRNTQRKDKKQQTTVTS